VRVSAEALRGHLNILAPEHHPMVRILIREYRHYSTFLFANDGV
jgi:hypothetical protein